MSVAFEQLAEVTIGAASPRQGLRMQEAARFLEVHFVGGRVRQGFRFQRVYLQGCPGQKNQKVWNAQLIFLEDSWVLFPDLVKPKLRHVLLTGKTRDITGLGERQKRDRVSLRLEGGGQLVLAGGSVEAHRQRLEAVIATGRHSQEHGQPDSAVTQVSMGRNTTGRGRLTTAVTLVVMLVLALVIVGVVRSLFGSGAGSSSCEAAVAPLRNSSVVANYQAQLVASCADYSTFVKAYDGTSHDLSVAPDFALIFCAASSEAETGGAAWTSNLCVTAREGSAALRGM